MGWVANAPRMGGRAANGRSFIQGRGEWERKGLYTTGIEKEDHLVAGVSRALMLNRK